MLRTAVILFCLFCVDSIGAAADVYRWIDAHGNVQFGDRPPAGVDEVEEFPLDLDVRIDADTDASERLARQKRLGEELARSRREREQERLEARRALIVAANRCARYRERLEMLDDAHIRWVKGINPDGSRVYYNDAEVAEIRADAVRGVSLYCR